MKKKQLSFISLCILLSSSAFVLSCETDSYEKGEGKYSLLQADFADLTVNNQKEAIAFTTDDGNNYQFESPYAIKWIETPDTVYRAIIYYNKVREGKATPMGVSAVPTLKPVRAALLKEQTQDPVDVESSWLAASGKYINIGLLIKTARVNDEEPPHTIGLAQDTIYTRDDGRRTACYRFLHSQNNIPEYYTNRRYVSILLPEEPLDTILLSIQTYNGLLERSFILH